MRIAGWKSRFTIESFFDSGSSRVDSLPDLFKVLCYFSLLSTKL